jgi:hypothetical protein
MSRLKPRKLPDHDPLEVTPHERFELTTLEPGGIAPYDLVIARMAKPIMNEAARKGLAAWWEIGEVIERIAWAYQVPKTKVEHDLHKAGERYIRAAVMRGLEEGAVWLDGQTGISDHAD